MSSLAAGAADDGNDDDNAATRLALAASASSSSSPLQQQDEESNSHNHHHHKEGDGVVVIEEEEGLWSHLKTFRISLIIFPLFFVANFSYNVSLAHTSVTSNTIISTTSSLWTFLFSTLYGLEQFTWLKMLGLVLSVGGTIMVGLSDENSGRDTIAGDLLCIFAAIM